MGDRVFKSDPLQDILSRGEADDWIEQLFTLSHCSEVCESFTLKNFKLRLVYSVKLSDDVSHF